MYLLRSGEDIKKNIGTEYFVVNPFRYTTSYSRFAETHFGKEQYIFAEIKSVIVVFFGHFRHRGHEDICFSLKIRNGRILRINTH